MMHIKPATVADMKQAMEYIWDGSYAPESHYTNRRAALAEIRDAYIGGRRALRFLMRKPNESEEQWNARRELFQNVRLVRTIVDARSDMIYGNPPERCFYVDGIEPDDPVNEEIDDAIGDVYTASNAKVLFRQRIAPARFRDGESNIKLIFTDDDAIPVRMAYLPTEAVLWVPDPEDADAVLGCVEIRRYGRSFKCVAHTLEGMVQIDSGWSAISGTDEDPPIPGHLPFVRFGGLDVRTDFGSWTDDAILDQKHLINVRSQFALGMRVQAFNQLFVSGRIKGSVYMGSDGKERIMFSPEAVIEGEEGTTAQYLNPNFPLTEAKDVEASWVKMALEAYSISAYTVDPSSAPEQPMALHIKMMRPLQLRTEDVAEFESSEYQLGKVVVAAASTVGLIGADPAGISCDIEFPETVLPMDKAAQRAADAADVAANRMTLESYVKRHVLPDASDQDVSEYLLQLQMQAGAATAQRATVLGALAPRTGILDRIQNDKGAPAPGGPNMVYGGGGATPGGAATTSGSSGGGVLYGNDGGRGTRRQTQEIT